MTRFVAIAACLAACGAVCPDDKDVDVPVTSGTYSPTDQYPECVSTPLMPAATNAEQHELVISADRKQVTETWARDGHNYKVVYDVTGSKKF